jgi:hypothetical protein
MELVEDAGGRFAASCCALGARSSWHISIIGRDKRIRGRGKSGHFERMEMIGSIQEIPCLQLDCKTIAEGKPKGLCRLLALPSQKGDTLYSPLYTPATPSMSCMLLPLPTPPPSKMRKNALATMLSVSCREIHRSCKGLIPSILRSHSRRCLSAATISTSLSTTISRSQYLFLIVGEAVKS